MAAPQQPFRVIRLLLQQPASGWIPPATSPAPIQRSTRFHSSVPVSGVSAAPLWFVPHRNAIGDRNRSGCAGRPPVGLDRVRSTSKHWFITPSPPASDASRKGPTGPEAAHSVPSAEALSRSQRSQPRIPRPAAEIRRTAAVESLMNKRPVTPSASRKQSGCNPPAIV